MNAASSPNRLLYVTNPLTQPIRISGTPRVSLNAAFSRRANLSAVLVCLPETGNGTIVTRGWIDPENRNSEYVERADHAGPVLPPELRRCRRRTWSSRPAAGSG